MDPTRRSFLGASVAAPALIASIQSAPAPAAGLPQDAQSALAIVMDLIIPAGDGMPSASQAGGMAYLQNLAEHDKDVATDIAKGLAVLQAYSGRSFQKPFAELSAEEQISVLKEIENTAPQQFDILRAYVYESYYIQPQIWKLIGYELYPTDHLGPHLAPFDESLIAGVRKMPKLYREA